VPALPVDPADGGVGRVDGLLIIYSGVALMVGAMVSVALCKDLENLDTEAVAGDGGKPELPTEPAAPVADAADAKTGAAETGGEP